MNFSKILQSVCLVLMCCVLVGCPEPIKPKLSGDFATVNDKTAADIGINASLQSEQVKVIKNATTQVEKEIVAARTQLDVIVPTLTEDTKRAFEPTYEHIANALTLFPTIDSSTAVFEKTIQDNVRAGKNIKALESRIIELENAKTELENNAIKKLYSNLSLVFGFGIISLIIGGLVFAFVDKKWGLVVLGIGLFSLAFAAGAIYYLKTVATIGIIILLSGSILCCIIAGAAIIKASRETKTVKVDNETKTQAIRENVELVEELKKALPEDKFTEFFGDHDSALARVIQSDSTKTIVNTVRSNIGLTNAGQTGSNKPI